MGKITNIRQYFYLTDEEREEKRLQAFIEDFKNLIKEVPTEDSILLFKTISVLFKNHLTEREASLIKEQKEIDNFLSEKNKLT